MMFRRVATALSGLIATGCALTNRSDPASVDDRARLLARAQVWTRTDVGRMDVRLGPAAPDAFAPGALVACEYEDEELGGTSPKFACELNDEHLKVKYGGTNGEVYGEVLATRLVWALGFGADRMYPVAVVCRDCPERLGGIALADGTRQFDPAAIERDIPGDEWPDGGPDGWSWAELDRVEPRRGGAPRAHRDALTLLAVLLQHTDSKPEQQAIVCLGQRDVDAAADCRRPWLAITDLGLTFGRASWTNANDISGVNLEAWRTTPVWKGEQGCVGNLARSFSGTLEDPVISEEGRRFLAGLLTQLTDQQLHDLFDVGRVELRLRDPTDALSGFATVDEWVTAFENKRAEIVDRRCDA